MGKIIYTLEGIQSAAREFASTMGDRKIYAFFGSMGAGKTTFVKALAREMGVVDDVVNSPTFSIVNEYMGANGLIYHFDFYRINSPQEAVDFGLFDYFNSGNICFMEWAELIEDLLPEDVVRVYITETADGSREMVIE